MLTVGFSWAALKVGEDKKFFEKHGKTLSQRRSTPPSPPQKKLAFSNNYCVSITTNIQVQVCFLVFSSGESHLQPDASWLGKSLNDERTIMWCDSSRWHSADLDSNNRRMRWSELALASLFGFDFIVETHQRRVEQPCVHVHAALCACAHLPACVSAGRWTKGQLFWWKPPTRPRRAPHFFHLATLSRSTSFFPLSRPSRVKQ